MFLATCGGCVWTGTHSGPKQCPAWTALGPAGRPRRSVLTKVSRSPGAVPSLIPREATASAQAAVAWSVAGATMNRFASTLPHIRLGCLQLLHTLVEARPHETRKRGRKKIAYSGLQTGPQSYGNESHRAALKVPYTPCSASGYYESNHSLA